MSPVPVTETPSFPVVTTWQSWMEPLVCSPTRAPTLVVPVTRGSSILRSRTVKNMLEKTPQRSESEAMTKFLRVWSPPTISFEGLATISAEATIGAKVAFGLRPLPAKSWRLWIETHSGEPHQALPSKSMSRSTSMCV